MPDTGWKRRFFALFGGQAASLFGSQVVRFALAWWLARTTGKPSVLAIGLAINFIPPAVLGPFAGVIVDRFSRKKILIVSDGTVALLAGFLGLSFFLGTIRVWQVYTFMLFSGVGDVLQTPALLATTTLMVPKEHLARFAGARSALNNIVTFVAPPCGALLIELAGTHSVLLLDVVTAVPAVLIVAAVPIPRPISTASSGHRNAFGTDLLEGIRYVLGHRGLRMNAIVIVIGTFLLRPASGFLPLLVRDNLAAGAPAFALLESVRAISGIAGGAFLAAWGGFDRSMNTSIVGTYGFALGIFLVAISPSTHLWVAVLGSGVQGFAWSVHFGGLYATYQAIVPPEKQGRFFAINRSVITFSAPVAMLLAGPIADMTGVLVFFYVGFLGVIGVATLRLLVPAIRNLEDTAPGTDTQSV